jgi:hypothetical protein
MNPSNPRNWKVVCSVCGAEFAMDETIDLADGHPQKEHPELEHPNFNLVWIGIGPKPKGGHVAGRSGRSSRKAKRRR